MASENNRGAGIGPRNLVAAVALALWLLPMVSRAQNAITDCSQAGLEAALVTGGTFSLVCDGVITISNTLQVTRDTTFDASNHRLMLSGLTQTNPANVIRLFQVHPGVRLTLANLTLANGHGTNGAAIYNNKGFVTLLDCTFSNNIYIARNGSKGGNGKSSTTESGGSGRSGGSGVAALGGALYNRLGTVSVVRCYFVTNGAAGGHGGRGGSGGDGRLLSGDGGSGGSGGKAHGGAIYNTGTLFVTNSSFYFNRVEAGSAGAGGTNGVAARGYTGLPGYGGSGGSAYGGAIYNASKARAHFVGSTFTLNAAFAGDSADAGGGVSKGRKGPNGPAGRGGAVCNVASAFFQNCTFFANRANGGNAGSGSPGSALGGDGGDGGSGWGGNVYNGKTTGATNCTFYDGGATGGTNGAAGSGHFAGKKGRKGSSRGGNVANGNGTFALVNCIIAFPLPGDNGYGAFKDLGYNLSSDGSMKLKGKGSLTKTDPLIGILAPNGGLTETVALLEGSPAINAGHPAFTLHTDQRGIIRTNFGRGDIGAFEYGLTLRPPVIITQPSSVVAQRGANVSFTVVAQGDPPLFYRWRTNGVNIPGANGTSLALNNISDSTTNFSYDVVVQNVSGSVTSSAARVTMIFPATIVTGPSGVTNVQGSNVEFGALVAGDGPLSYSWLYTGTNGTIIVAGATLPRLSLFDVPTNFSGFFQAVAYNTFSIATSAPAALVVTSAPPVITQQPQSLIVEPGEPVEFSVQIGPGSLPVRYSWYFNDTLIPGLSYTNISYTNFASIFDDSVQTNQQGTYYVVITNIAGAVTSTPFTLAVTTTPPFIVTAPHDAEVESGGSTNFSVVANGSRPLTYYWYFNETTLLQAGTNFVLTLNNASPDDIGEYTVVVSNRYGTVTSDPVTLDVIVVPVMITGHPESQDIYSGESVTFAVVAEGTQPFGYQWYKDDVAIPGANSITYTIDNTSPEDGGDYTVEVSNYAGSEFSDPALLTVSDSEPIIEEQPESIAATNGTTASLTAVVRGSRPMFFQWQKDGEGIPGATNSTLTFTNLEYDDAGDYTLTVTNQFGEDFSEPATLVVLAEDMQVLRDENRALIIFPTEEGIEYTVEYRDPDFDWIEIESDNLPIEGDGNEQSFEDPEPGAQNLTDREYRVVGRPIVSDEEEE